MSATVVPPPLTMLFARTVPPLMLRVPEAEPLMTLARRMEVLATSKAEPFTLTVPMPALAPVTN